MKNLLLSSALLSSLAFIGCSSAYRTAQTPDDVYYSEGSPVQELARNESKNQPDGYTSYWERQDDNMLRMKVNDRDKWSEVDDIDYWQGYNNNYWVNYNTMWNSPWAMNSWNNPWLWNSPWAWNTPYHGSAFYSTIGWNTGWGWGMNTGWGWNSWGLGFNSWNRNWSNPYCWNQPVKVINKYPVGGRSAGSLNAYSNYNYTRSNSGLNKNMRTVSPGSSRSIWESGNAPSGTSSGSSLFRTITRPSSSSGMGGSSYDRPARTFGGSSSGGSSSGGVMSSGGGSGSSGSSGTSRRGG